LAKVETGGNRIVTHDKLFLVIPSWSELLGYQTLGTFAGKPVLKIQSDPVIFWVAAEAAIQEADSDRVYYCIFGLGYLFSKFQLKSGPYTLDRRELTGLILSDFVYDQMASARALTLENDPDVVVSAHAIKVPLDLSNKTPTQKTFIKGALMNALNPYKEGILEMMEHIRKPDSYLLDKEEGGHRLLVTHEAFFNEILVSENLEVSADSSYMQGAPAIKGVLTGADQFLGERFTPAELASIQVATAGLKRLVAKTSFNPAYIFSLIENVAEEAVPKSRVAPAPGSPTKKVSKPPASTGQRRRILLTAYSQERPVVPWPDEFPRLALEDVEAEAREKVAALEPEPVAKYAPPNVDIEPVPGAEEEKFELRNYESPTVEQRSLPSMPLDNERDILQYLRFVVEDDYDLPAISQAIEQAHARIRRLSLHTPYLFEMVKLQNLYSKKAPGTGANATEKRQLLEKIDKWMSSAK
jgi:hypothetical protein